jgi:hypothetical protein
VLLWARSGAALSHLTAGRLWKLEGLGIAPPEEITVSVPATRVLDPIPKVRVYRTRSLVSTHAGRAPFEKDRQQISALAANGWTTLLVTARRMETDSETFVTELRRALANGRAVPV